MVSITDDKSPPLPSVYFKLFEEDNTSSMLDRPRPRRLFGEIKNLKEIWSRVYLRADQKGNLKKHLDIVSENTNRIVTWKLDSEGRNCSVFHPTEKLKKPLVLWLKRLTP